MSLTSMVPWFTLVACLGTQALRLHQSIHPLLSTSNPQILQVIMDLAITIDGAACQPRLLNLTYDHLVLIRSRRERLFKPSVIATVVDSQNLAHRADGMLMLVLFDEGVL